MKISMEEFGRLADSLVNTSLFRGSAYENGMLSAYGGMVFFNRRQLKKGDKILARHPLVKGHVIYELDGPDEDDDELGSCRND